jgi:putative nucleotidyltransferase with HDIG domain
MDENLIKHAKNVAYLSYQLSQGVDLTEREKKDIFIGGLFHDIGKVEIPEHILYKPGPLTPEEWAIMKEHPQHSYEILKKWGLSESVLLIAKHHHENYDGSGYPDGLTEEKIPIGSRIVRIADTYSALSQTRTYKKSFSLEKIYLTMDYGRYFYDPALYQFFIQQKKGLAV